MVAPPVPVRARAVLGAGVGGSGSSAGGAPAELGTGAGHAGNCRRTVRCTWVVAAGEACRFVAPCAAAAVAAAVGAARASVAQIDAALNRTRRLRRARA